MHSPGFYDPKKINEIFLPRFAQVKEEALAIEGIPASVKDSPGERTALLLIDEQIDFCNPKGSLYVPGAENDIANTIGFIFRNFGKITTIYPTLDSHLTFQIFYGVWWLDENGNHPAPFTIITEKDVESGKYRPIELPEWSALYVRELGTNAHKPLCIWPEHTMIGTPGHAIVPALYEVCYLHSLLRKSKIGFEHKGDLPESEMYGVFSPEVKVPGLPRGGINTELLDLLDSHDRIVVAGEAKSHCVLESVRQLAGYYLNKPETLSKIYVLEDCMSSVRHPTVDFEAIAEKEFAQLANLGLHIHKSTDLVL
jgi:nicotinamidase/pyrazinamidase